MTQAFLIIALLVIGFLAGITVSCSTLILKIERITKTHSTNEAIRKIRSITNNMNQMSKDVKKYGKQVNDLTKSVEKHNQKISKNSNKTKK